MSRPQDRERLAAQSRKAAEQREVRLGVLPSAPEAERALLALLMVDGYAFDEVAWQFERDDLHDERHKRLYDLLGAMRQAGEAIDLVTVPERIARTGRAELFGGLSYVIDLPEHAPPPASATAYAGLVSRTARLRRLASLSHRIAQAACDNSDDAEVIAQTTSAEILAETMPKGSKAGPSSATAASILDGMEQRRRDRAERARNGELANGYVETGLDELDAILGGGLPYRQTTILQAHTSHAKTSLALHVVRKAVLARRPIPALVISLEMDRERVMQRLLQAESGVPAKKYERLAMEQAEAWRWEEAESAFRRSPLAVVDARQMNVLQIVAQVRMWDQRFKAQGYQGLGLLVVDYLGKIKPSRPGQPRWEAIGELSEAMNALVAATGVAGLVLAQTNREALSDRDPRPKLWHLAESSSIERDADIVIAGFYEKKFRESAPQGRYEIDVQKNRDGAAHRRFPVYFDELTTSFRNATDDEIHAWRAQEAAEKAKKEGKAKEPPTSKPAAPSKPGEAAPSRGAGQTSIPAHPDDDPLLAET